MDNLKRARSWNRRIQPRIDLKIVEPALYSTLFESEFMQKLFREKDMLLGRAGKRKDTRD